MFKQKKTVITIFLMVSIVFLSKTTFANNLVDLAKTPEYTKEFQKYIELTDEEKEKVLIPRIFNDGKTKKKITNPFNLMTLVGSAADTSYSLTETIPANVVVKDQKSTNSCWTFASLSSLETNLALNSTDKTKVYDFSERHMEYATSRLFANGQVNENGFNRKVGDGGTWDIATSYLTNGMGAINESQMPFEDNENTINLSQIQNKTVTSQVYDTINFPSYEATDNKTQIKNQMKAFIKEYGSISAYIHGAQLFSEYYNNATGALYCDDAEECIPDHGVSIVGWNDDYDVDNFNEDHKPQSSGAWIIKNSWGTSLEEDLSQLKQELFNTYRTELAQMGITSASAIPDSYITQMGFTIENGKAKLNVGDNGFMYVSYEDVNIYLNLLGVMKSANSLDYENIYQYDNFGSLYRIAIQSEDSNVYVGNIFNKKTTGKEYLTQVAITAPETYTCTVYVNPNGSSMQKSSLQKIKLKAGGYSETFDAGYHTLEFEKPLEIKSNDFAVVIEIQPISQDGVLIAAEADVTPLNAEIGKIYNVVELENKKCFYSIEGYIDTNEWQDLSEMSSVTNGEVLNCDSTIKAFTTSTVDESLLEQEEPTPEPETPSSEEVESAENSDFTNAEIKIKKLKEYLSYSFEEECVILDVEVNNIVRNLNNDDYEYYYYLSYDDSENNISNWVKIKESQTEKNKLVFVMNTEDVPNYQEILDNAEDNKDLYIYIKEVVKNGTSQSTVVSKALPIKADEDTDVEIYINNEKITIDEDIIDSFVQDTNNYNNNYNYSNNTNGSTNTTTIRNGTSSSLITAKDATTATTTLPKAGIKTLVICILIISIIGIVVYIRYSNLKKYIK